MFSARIFLFFITTSLIVVLSASQSKATLVCTDTVQADATICGLINAAATNVFVGGNFGAPSGTKGTLDINNGSHLTAPSPSPQGYIAAEKGTTGTVTVEGPGSQWSLSGVFANGDSDDGLGGFLSVGRD